MKQTARSDAVLAHDGVFVLCGRRNERVTIQSNPRPRVVRGLYVRDACWGDTAGDGGLTLKFNMDAALSRLLALVTVFEYASVCE